jgi:hypothetical protein
MPLSIDRRTSEHDQKDEYAPEPRLHFLGADPVLGHIADARAELQRRPDRDQQCGDGDGFFDESADEAHDNGNHDSDGD